MICVMPIKSGEKIHSRVIAGIASQTIPVDLLISSLPSIVGGHVREIDINFNRNYLQSLVNSDDDDEYIWLLDSDVVIPANAVESMLQYIKLNSHLDCVAINTKEQYSNEHIVTACALIKTSLYKQIDFLSQPSICQCSLIAMRARVEYMHGIDGYEI